MKYPWGVEEETLRGGQLRRKEISTLIANPGEIKQSKRCKYCLWHRNQSLWDKGVGRGYPCDRAGQVNLGT